MTWRKDDRMNEYLTMSKQATMNKSSKIIKIKKLNVENVRE